MKMIPFESIEQDKFVYFPASSFSKVLIFDLDETLIHCVDDIEADNPEVILEIKFPDEEEPVCAGINLRPHMMECLREASKLM